MTENVLLEGFEKLARYYEPEWRFRRQDDEYLLKTRLVGFNGDLVFRFAREYDKPLLYIQYIILEPPGEKSDELKILYKLNRRLRVQHGVRFTRQRLDADRLHVSIERILPMRFYQDPLEFHRILQSFVEYLERFMPMYQSVWEVHGQGEQIRLWANPSSRMIH